LRRDLRGPGRELDATLVACDRRLAAGPHGTEVEVVG
jgi:hypothetical protein